MKWRPRACVKCKWNDRCSGDQRRKVGGRGVFKNMNMKLLKSEVVMPVEKVFILWQMYKLINGVVL